MAFKVQKVSSKQNNAFFEMDIAATNWLKHPNIIGLKDYGNAQYLDNNNDIQSMQYMVTEYAENGELFDLISNSKTLFPEYYAKRLMVQIL